MSFYIPEDRLMTIKEAAARLAISKKTLLRHVADGRLEFVDVGTVTRVHRRFSLSQLEQFVSTRRGQESFPCLSTRQQAVPSITTTFRLTATAFTDLPRPAIDAKPRR
ncbi:MULTISPECIES: helix-turn-helix domain-containing protein [Rhizobium]|uniref:helix-turn-helix domain-containing protein n=1 Tax=Rhizobium TaxID=379 RepID=UPI001C924FB8|nr:helix-turn-helix domain-containing protein [Rhizobium laguerreae]MBY5714463.1 helix-turn-helix domain-containing protein [Rhizobium leguminosarum]